MDAINFRLRQLEAVEADLLSQRQTTIEKRAQEDAEILRRRQEEDEEYTGALRDRDQEEDVSVSFLRRQNLGIDVFFTGLASKAKDT